MKRKTANIFDLHSWGFEPRIFDQFVDTILINCVKYHVLMYFGLINNKANHSGTGQPAMSPNKDKLLNITF